VLVATGRYAGQVSDAQPQQQYQVRFDWGVAGFQALAGHSDVIILADALPPVRPPAAPTGERQPAASTSLAAHRVLAAGLRNRSAVAEWVLERQAEKGGRFSVAVIAVGESRPDGSLRLAVEDLLAAGAVIDALSDLGIDHCSPEAAAASAGFVGLKRALRHLISGSESGQALGASGRQDLVHAAGVLDDSRDVTEIRDFDFPG
jgi:2-phosphosulfolactate phosphatase